MPVDKSSSECKGDEVVKFTQPFFGDKCQFLFTGGFELANSRPKAFQYAYLSIQANFGFHFSSCLFKLDSDARTYGCALGRAHPSIYSSIDCGVRLLVGLTPRDAEAEAEAEAAEAALFGWKRKRKRFLKITWKRKRKRKRL